jgi:hypothetical protein
MFHAVSMLFKCGWPLAGIVTTSAGASRGMITRHPTFVGGDEDVDAVATFSALNCRSCARQG